MNKSWVLGDDKFKHAIEQQLARRVTSLAKGGDRKSGLGHRFATSPTFTQSSPLSFWV